MGTAPIEIDPTAAERVPGLWAVSRTVVRDPELEATALPDVATLLDAAWARENLKDHERVAAFRQVSWTAGVDPTKNRPSGEALVRRALGGKPLPQILPLVDAYNLASAKTLVPIGAYDLANVSLPLSVRMARDGEMFHGIAREPEPLSPDRIVYGDAEQRIAGVLMWRDGQATCVRPTSERVLLVTVAAAPARPEWAVEALDEACVLARRVGFKPDGDASVVAS